MSDSSDDDTGIGRLCSIDSDGLIRSVNSGKFPIRFSTDSFAAHYVDDIMMIYMNPMFIWRLIHANKNFSDAEKEFDFQKLKLFVMRLGTEIYLTNREVEYKLDGVVNYKPSSRMFGLIHSSYSRLYMSIQRKYDQTDVVKHLLDSYILMLRYISDS
jgi:hypothetical protein